ncbi:MAG: hypothetical protein QXL35_06510 [Candidatus Bathyarchaeia archaeon]
MSNSRIIDIDKELSKEAGVLHFEMRRAKRDFGLADACVLAASKRIGSKILTGDPHFEGLEGADFI